MLEWKCSTLKYDPLISIDLWIYALLSICVQSMVERNVDEIYIPVMLSMKHADNVTRWEAQ